MLSVLGFLSLILISLIAATFIKALEDSKKYKNDDIDFCFCVNDEVFCRCRRCRNSIINNGECNHCISCIDGEKSVNGCEYYHDINTPTE